MYVVRSQKLICTVGKIDFGTSVVGVGKNRKLFFTATLFMKYYSRNNQYLKQIAQNSRLKRDIIRSTIIDKDVTSLKFYRLTGERGMHPEKKQISYSASTKLFLINMYYG